MPSTLQRTTTCIILLFRYPPQHSYYFCLQTAVYVGEYVQACI